MDKYKIADIADVQSGLVLGRKAAKTGTAPYLYKRLTLKSITEDGLLDKTSLENYEACEILDENFLTHENDIIIRLFAPVCAVLVTKENEGLIVPSQLAIIRIKKDSPILPGYLNAYLNNKNVLENLIIDAGKTAQKIIKIGNVIEQEILFLPKKKQKSIADILSEHMKTIELYKKLIEQENLRTKTVIKDIIGGKR